MFWLYHKKTLRHANKGLMYKNGIAKKKRKQKWKRETIKGQRNTKMPQNEYYSFSLRKEKDNRTNYSH